MAYIAELIEDRSCLQMGIGAIPDAVLGCLHNHRDLGVHTEMFSDGLIDLFDKVSAEPASAAQAAPQVPSTQEVPF